jgi:hypothetical protein
LTLCHLLLVANLSAAACRSCGWFSTPGDYLYILKKAIIGLREAGVKNIMLTTPPPVGLRHPEGPVSIDESLLPMTHCYHSATLPWLWQPVTPDKAEAGVPYSTHDRAFGPCHAACVTLDVTATSSSLPGTAALGITFGEDKPAGALC